MAQKEFRKLDLKDAFLFATVLEDAEIYQLVLELTMGRPVGPMSIQVEHSALFSKDLRYVRFDVYVGDTANVFYGMEMQNSRKKELPKRARYHQAELDATFLKPDEKFQESPTSHVIFIYTYDPLHSGLYHCTYEERCEETGECPGDGTCKIYLNTKGTNKAGVPQELVHFLEYVEMSTDSCMETCKDEKTRKLHQKMEVIKKNRRPEESYVTIEELSENRAAEGEAEDKVEERQLTSELVSLMTRDGLTDEIDRLSEDEDFCSFILEEYHL